MRGLKRRHPPATDVPRLQSAALALGLLLVTTACASLRNTPEQEATLSVLRACDNYPGVWIDRVTPDGRYYVKQNNEENWRLFRDCVVRQRLDASKARYVQAEPKDLLYRAYFIKVALASNVTLQQLPAPVSEFRVDEPVTFFLDIYKSGREQSAKFKWYRPDGGLAAQQDRVFRDAAGTSSRTWFAQHLPSRDVQLPGTWSMELTIGTQVVGRYEFTVTPQ